VSGPPIAREPEIDRGPARAAASEVSHFPPDRPAPALPGYTPIEALSGAGELVRWRSRRDADHAAVLVVAPASQHPTPAILRRLQHEYGLRADLDPAWAARPCAIAEIDGQSRLVLDDPGGEPLERLLRAPMPIDRFLPIAIALAAALDGVHGRGLIHKDIKPANILFDDATGTVRFTGFGIASRLTQERQTLEPPEVIAGTLAYMAPEQTGRMNRSVDWRSDLYALGVTFYQMLTGGLPFSANEPMEWVHCHVARPPEPPDERMPGLPGVLSAIILKLLAKTAEERYQTASGLEADLRTCLKAWQAHGRIALFPLGACDVSNRLVVPEKLYGRDPQVRIILDAFGRLAADGGTQLLIVSGDSGVGKSALVHVLHKVVAQPRGFFLSGKFDQYKRDVPYDTFAQAFRHFVRQLLIMRDEQADIWREAIRDAIGINGQLVVDLVPELELLIGRQPPVPALAPREAQNRFHAVLVRFIRAIAGKGHPLALFLDDLQWLDAASLKLIEHLISDPIADPGTGHLLLIGAYRGNEVGPAHPLTLMLDAARKTAAKIRDIALAPLSADDIGELVADALRCERARSDALARLVHEKTGGNPFFAIQFLNALRDERLLELDQRATAWRWDLERIRAKGFTDNVVTLMTGKLNRFSPATRDVLKQLACLGNRAEVALLAKVSARSEEDMRADLAEAVGEGLVVLSGDGSCAFFHDRVQEAAYALIPAARRAGAHLRIGRLLLSRLPGEATGEQVFEVTNQLNRALELMPDATERTALCWLNFRAGQRAKAAVAHASARNYLAQAAALMPPDDWSDRYEEAFTLHLDLAECDYLVGNGPAAEALIDVLLGRARSQIDQATVHRLRMRLYHLSGQFDGAVTAALAALRLFGVTFPQSDQEIEAAFALEKRNIAANLAGRPIAEVVDAPAAADPAARMVIDIIGESLFAVQNARPKLRPLFAARGVNFSLCHGNVAESSLSYSHYATVLASTFDIPAAFEFSELALRLLDKLDDRQLIGTILALHALYVNHWRRPFATCIPLLERSLRASLDIGDLANANYVASQLVSMLLAKGGTTLEEVANASRQAEIFAKETRNTGTYNWIKLRERFVACLQGKTREPGSFDDGVFDEKEWLAKATKARPFDILVGGYCALKLAALFTYGRHAEALEMAVQVAAFAPYLAGNSGDASRCFYHALTLTALYPPRPAAPPLEFSATLADHLWKLKIWAENCPESYQSGYALVSAEIARVEGRDGDAMQLYEQAISSARENGLTLFEGIAGELAAQFYRGRGFDLIAEAYLRNARYNYLRFGALGKVKQLDLRYPHREERGPDTATVGVPVEHLDLVTVVKASQAVSGEIVHDDLVKTLLMIAVEHAGARKGLLILPRGGVLAIEAQALTGPAGIKVVLRPAPAAAAELPESVLHYMVRTNKAVILDDARTPGLFSEDAYLRRAQTRSVLCLPLVKQTKLIGALYLENDLTPGVFTPDRIAVLELLASQAAISLENARLYTELQQHASRVSDLYNNAPCGYHALDKDGVFVEVNDTELGWFGLTRAEVIGKLGIADVLTPESYQAFRDEFSRSKELGAVRDLEITLRRSGGETMPALLSGTLVKDEAGNYAMNRSTVYHISERKRAEAAVRERELDALLRENQKLTALSTVAGGVAHEFNNILVPIIALTTMTARRLPDNGRERKNLETVLGQANRAKELIKQVVAFSRAETCADLVSQDIGPVVEEALRLLRATLPKTVALHADLAPALPQVRCDGAQFQQLLTNLWINAVQSIGDHLGTIAVRLAARYVDVEMPSRFGPIVPGRYVVLDIADDGAGMDGATLSRIFEPFFTTKQVGAGTGLGLAVVHGTVKSLGGAIHVESRPGEGATFRLFLPAVAPSPELGARPLASSSMATARPAA
jgi:PAS domain S-box-containing protein